MTTPAQIQEAATQFIIKWRDDPRTPRKSITRVALYAALVHQFDHTRLSSGQALTEDIMIAIAADPDVNGVYNNTGARAKIVFN